MIYYPDFLIDQWILDDVNQGDLTTRILGAGNCRGRMTFSLKEQGRVSGVEAGERVLRRLGLDITGKAEDGSDINAGGILLSASGSAAALHQGWKLCQNILEWSCGVATYTALMVGAVRKINSAAQVGTTRKNIPGTKLLALAAVLNGGGLIHRGGTAETVLLFKNHRNFLDFGGAAEDWKKLVANLGSAAPEKKIAVEAESYDEALRALDAEPDILQLDKFSPADLQKIAEAASNRGSHCLISAAGGIDKDNAALYAAAGAQFIVSSAPYYAKPADVKVLIGK